MGEGPNGAGLDILGPVAESERALQSSGRSGGGATEAGGSAPCKSGGPRGGAPFWGRIVIMSGGAMSPPAGPVGGAAG